jgi:lysophospholipase L1-like esterase
MANYEAKPMKIQTLIAIGLFWLMMLSSAGFAQQDQPNAKSSVSFPETDDAPGFGPIRRYDWFRNVWSSQRDKWAKSAAKDQGAVVFLGDSITQGWGETMRSGFDDMPVANRGISGDTTRGMLFRLHEDVLSLQPRALVMLMGTNDLEENASPEEIVANFKLILAAVKQQSADVPIILCLVFPSSATKNRSADKVKRLNELYSEAIRGDTQVTVVDTWTLFANELGDAKVEEFPDLLHPNDLGYKKWTAALRPIFATLGLIETSGDSFELEPGFGSLFNGKDLTGWGFRPTPKGSGKKRPANAPVFPTVDEPIGFDGKTESNDNRYAVIHGRLVVRTPTEGRRIQQLWTQAEFDSDFVLKLEFRATPNADSGVFIRQPQLQCRDYPLAGPYTGLEKYRPQDWNEMEVTVRGTTARCTCNGEVLEEALTVPASGPIGLEGDRGQMEYRRIRIKRL